MTIRSPCISTSTRLPSRSLARSETSFGMRSPRLFPQREIRTSIRFSTDCAVYTAYILGAAVKIVSRQTGLARHAKTSYAGQYGCRHRRDLSLPGQGAERRSDGAGLGDARRLPAGGPALCHCPQHDGVRPSPPEMVAENLFRH